MKEYLKIAVVALIVVIGWTFVNSKFKLISFFEEK
jgi:hypothetical protein